MFIQSFFTVFDQVLILFILMGAGFAMQKAGLFGKDGVTAMSNAVLWGATPCLIIESFQQEFDRQLAGSLLVFSAVAVGAIILSLYIVPLVFGRGFRDETKLLSFACTFSNCGFMGIPLAAAVFGEEGALYASVFVAVFNFVQWTLGYVSLSGKGLNLKKTIINPGVLGILAGVPLFIFSVKLPYVISESISLLASFNTPVAMLIIGATLAAAELSKSLSDKRVLLVCAVRLIIEPLIALALLYFLPLPLAHVPLCVLMIEFAAPCGATTVIIGGMCGKNTELGGSCVTVSTLCSLATLPLFVSVVEYLL